MGSHHTLNLVLILVLSMLLRIETTETNRELSSGERHCYGKICDYNYIDNNKRDFTQTEPTPSYNHPFSIGINHAHEVDDSSGEQVNESSPALDEYDSETRNSRVPWVTDAQETFDTGFKESPVTHTGSSRNHYILSPNIFEEQLGDASEYITENSKERYSQPLRFKPSKEDPGSLIYHIGFPNQIQYFRGHPYKHSRVSENYLRVKQQNTRDDYRDSNDAPNSELTDKAKAIPKLPLPKDQKLEFQESSHGETRPGILPYAYSGFKDFLEVSKSNEANPTNSQKLTTSTFSPKKLEHGIVESPISSTTSAPLYFPISFKIDPTTTLSPIEMYYMYANPVNSPQTLGGYQFSAFGNSGGVPNFDYLGFGGGLNF